MCADRSCVLEVKIGSREFKVEILVLPIKEFDIIFGMDWLSEQRACIDCTSKEVTLGQNTEQETKFIGMQGMSGMLLSALQVVKAVRKGAELFFTLIDAVTPKASVSEVPIVSDYADVFPKDLPGLPPQREIDFAIELVPGCETCGPFAVSGSAKRNGRTESSVARIVGAGIHTPKYVTLERACSFCKKERRWFATMY
ncbi:hypothetical protein KSP39_PZI007470 [Platanthera zijinensis]|uniref:Uncharacterized protein n=1 Tax=Platanthera zijinensis TaxID=2320716 RepID=A0AAP0BRF7_9ASPA